MIIKILRSTVTVDPKALPGTMPVDVIRIHIAYRAENEKFLTFDSSDSLLLPVGVALQLRDALTEFLK